VYRGIKQKKYCEYKAGKNPALMCIKYWRVKMYKVKVFNNTNEFLDWTEKFDDCYEYQFIPTIVVDQKKSSVCADFMTVCKSWKTVLRRFRKAFETFDGIISWCDGLYETLE
jgi:hypothetical protein